ncbi:MAG: hypothetical protein KJP21_07130 [Bacteroidia bacterium]|nr:hypothetical protein [Bacteroidia bacterium]
MNTTDKQILIVAARNGTLWTSVLLLLSYFKNGMINWNYTPLWFLFFAGTGALRFYYFHKKSTD